jgi:hypothetical protein
MASAFFITSYLKQCVPYSDKEALLEKIALFHGSHNILTNMPTFR